MKLFFFMDHNPKNKSGVSWKMWKIQRSDRQVTVWWGPATISRHRLRPANTLQSKTWLFRSETQAKDEEERRIREKLVEGYRRMTKRRNA